MPGRKTRPEPLIRRVISDDEFLRRCRAASQTAPAYPESTVSDAARPAPTAGSQAVCTLTRACNSQLTLIPATSATAARLMPAARPGC
ncbi:MAG TPA: hypothetical protein VF940_30945 [Streptosporangiaceae bacterium]